MQWINIAVLLFVAIIARQANANPSGAPVGACLDDMTPGHNAVPQQNPSPYVITVDGGTQYRAGENKMITVMGSSAMLKGVICRVRPAANPTFSDVLGTMALLDGETNLQLLDCGIANEMDSAVTHTNNNDKTMVQFYWQASQDVGDVQVMCSFVQNQLTFWIEQFSETLTFQEAADDGADDNGAGDPSTTDASMNQAQSGSSTLVGSSLLLAVIFTVRRLLL